MLYHAGLAERVLEDTIKAMEDLSEAGSNFDSVSPRGRDRLLHGLGDFQGRDQLPSTDSVRVNLGDSLMGRAYQDTQSGSSVLTVLERELGTHTGPHTVADKVLQIDLENGNMTSLVTSAPACTSSNA